MAVDWKDRKFSIPHVDDEDKHTYFRIKKLLAMEAFHVMEILRPVAIEVAGSVAVGDEEDSASQTVQLFSAVAQMLDIELLDKVRNILFKHVQYSRNGKNYIVLRGREDEAFYKLDPLHVYEVLIRAFVVNFTNTFSVFQSRFGLSPNTGTTHIQT